MRTERITEAKPCKEALTRGQWKSWCNASNLAIVGILQPLEQDLLQIRYSGPNTLPWIKRDMSLENLCMDAKDSVCFDPRDKVFGLLGLAPKINLTADYSTTLFALFQGVVASAMHQSILCPKIGLARILQYSFVMSISDKTLEEVQQMKALFRLPSVENTQLLYASGYVVGRIDDLDMAWPNGIHMNHARTTHPWLQNVAKSAQEALRQRFRLQNEEVYGELQSELDAVHAIHSQISYGSDKINPFLVNSSNSSNSSSSRQHMLLKDKNCNLSSLQVFRADVQSDALATFKHSEGVVPKNTQIGDIACVIDISAANHRSHERHTIHFVLRWQVDRYRFVGKALVPSHCKNLRTQREIHLWMNSSVLQILTA